MDTIGLVHDVNNLLAHPYALKVTGEGEECKIEKRSIFGIIVAWLSSFFTGSETQALEYLKQKNVTEIGTLPTDPTEWTPLLRETVKTQKLYERITVDETDLSKNLDTITYKSLYASLLNKVLDEDQLSKIYQPKDEYILRDFSPQDVALVRKITIGEKEVNIADEFPTQDEVEIVTTAIETLPDSLQMQACTALQQQNITGVTQDTQNKFMEKAGALASFTLDSANASLNIQENKGVLTLTYTLPLQGFSIDNTPIESTAGTVIRTLTISPDGILSATQTFSYK